ncbi:MAG: hypothetical protein A2W90_11225 [Bacteroidetes bacterium GWF2_42_66]|nr:MAG: hypothetical protein A2W92_10215 [Bacteroidetes bacterium GWA2_42_15]OFY01852.1 MAG: hypothetical protein A2W89_23345 [Bacteroidetes bacterium GWE2_42_39]OFY44853.1 MAG: hypothetical protein A2W90_11225 [Bacteroidetes bacterium GWF2_42_66]HBL75980.1 hypothetical protein [Prolixibacteraceae bacterium]HCR89973.1 hypothetical protein [Prolixibacteraceae bacterium]
MIEKSYSIQPASDKNLPVFFGIESCFLQAGIASHPITPKILLLFFNEGVDTKGEMNGKRGYPKRQIIILLILCNSVNDFM